VVVLAATLVAATQAKADSATGNLAPNGAMYTTISATLTVDGGFVIEGTPSAKLMMLKAGGNPNVPADFVEVIALPAWNVNTATGNAATATGTTTIGNNLMPATTLRIRITYKKRPAGQPPGSNVVTPLPIFTSTL
jgi:hypothetical protein